MEEKCYSLEDVLTVASFSSSLSGKMMAEIKRFVWLVYRHFYFFLVYIVHLNFVPNVDEQIISGGPIMYLKHILLCIRV